MSLSQRQMTLCDERGHEWVPRIDPEGGLWQKCMDCGKQEDLEDDED